MGAVFSVGTSAASALASCCVGSAASCVCSGLKTIMPSGYTAAKVYALILFFGASLRLVSLCRAAIVNRVAAPACRVNKLTSQLAYACYVCATPAGAVCQPPSYHLDAHTRTHTQPRW